MKLHLDNNKSEEKSTVTQSSPNKGFSIALYNFQPYICNSLIFQENGSYQHDCYYPQHLVKEKKMGPWPMLAFIAI